MAMQTYVYKEVDGLEIHADVYLPDDAKGPLPVILHIHGGALMCGNRMGFNVKIRDKSLGRGWAFVSIDYRLAPETKTAGILEDVRDAFRWVREEGPKLFGADPDRIATTGGSAGGFLTLVSGYAVSPPPRALAPFYGYCDIAGRWLTDPSAYHLARPQLSEEEARAHVGDTPIAVHGATPNRGAFYWYCRQTGIWPKEVTGHDPATENEAYDAFCPIRNVTGDYPPTMFLHGVADVEIPWEESADMGKELDRHGIENEVVLVDGADHGFDMGMALVPSARVPDADEIEGLLERTMDFFARHLA